jgi:WD40 repeat protein
LYYINVDNKECKAIHLGSTVADAKLSPDKKTIALLCGGYKLKYLNVEEIPSGIVNLHKSQYNIFQGYGWSPDSKYIVIADLGVMRIIDIFDKEYKFLEKKDFPQSATDLAKIVWTF